jgi:hypothetical protein
VCIEPFRVAEQVVSDLKTRIRNTGGLTAPWRSMVATGRIAGVIARFALLNSFLEVRDAIAAFPAGHVAGQLRAQY